MIVNDPVYGRQQSTDPLALELINTPQMQRLKGVNQYGIWNLLDEKYFTSRFDHCLGVYFLLRKLGASRQEQIAGLLHDIAHTAFSHVVDYVFDDAVSQTVHETFHEKVIFGSEIPRILQRNGMDAAVIIDEKKFNILERDMPNLCADRVDYFLRDSLLVGVCSTTEVQSIVNSLTVHDEEIMLNSAEVAALMASKFIEMGNTFWASHVQAGSYHLMGNILKDALRRKSITENDFFLTDAELLHKLRGDSLACRELQRIGYSSIQPGTESDYTYHAKTKARYVDPKVVYNGAVQRVTDLVPEISATIDGFRKRIAKGHFVKIAQAI